MSRVLHPTLDAGQRRELFALGIRLFNRGDFFACHEAWEEIWRSTTPHPKDLFQGLIQVGVGMYHFHEKQRHHVAVRVLGKGRRRLLPLAPESHGLDLGSLLADVEAWRAWLRDPRGKPPADPRLLVVDPSRVC